MTHYKRLMRLASLLLAALVVTSTLAVVVHATQTITTPNASLISYSLGAGANSGAITPPENQSVLVMGVQTTTGFRGVGFVTMLHVPSSFLEWVGLESTPGATITQGYSGTVGTHIVYLDFGHQVDIQVDGTDSFRVHNGSTGTRTGKVTMIW